MQDTKLSKGGIAKHTLLSTALPSELSSLNKYASTAAQLEEKEWLNKQGYANDAEDNDLSDDNQDLADGDNQGKKKRRRKKKKRNKQQQPVLQQPNRLEINRDDLYTSILPSIHSIGLLTVIRARTKAFRTTRSMATILCTWAKS